MALKRPRDEIPIDGHGAAHGNTLSTFPHIASTNEFIFLFQTMVPILHMSTRKDGWRRLSDTTRNDRCLPVQQFRISSHVTWRSFISFFLAGACSGSSTPRLQFSSLSGQYTLSFGQKVYASGGDYSPHPRCMWAVVLQDRPRPMLNRVQVL
jgi:hypothetical protein